ncbi:MAG: peptidase S1 [Verrucomicrobia bacterium]|nr:MAG: peptidase S1 [Verrucomicrobiota bacterium]
MLNSLNRSRSNHAQSYALLKPQGTTRHQVRYALLIWLFCLSIGLAANPAPQLKTQDGDISPEVRSRTSLAPIVKKVAPSVVNIYSSMTVRQRANPLLEDPFLRRFFGQEPDEDSSRPDSSRTRKAESLGSGVIVSADGYILTAYHVIEGADKVQVALADGNQDEFEARIVGLDPPTDVAVLKIQAKHNLPAITIGDSDKLQVGDLVLALGNPFRVGQTVTSGIVSGLGRGGFEVNAYENFIQTDAAINPGNSGGALVDAEGRLVGINTIIVSSSGGFMGIGFAVPVNMARYVMDRLIQYGKVTRGYLGINIQPLTTELAKEFNLPDESSGVLVGGVSAGSAAEKAGLREGDVITDLDGKKVTDPSKLRLLVAQTAPGTQVTLRILRGAPGEKSLQKTITARLGELPQQVMASGRSRGSQGRPGSANIDALEGVSVADIDSAARHEYGIPSGMKGALVVNVDPGSAAADTGLQTGDVILEINRHQLQNADDAVAQSERIKGKRVLLRVWSHASGGPGGTRYIVIEPPKER